MEVESGVNHSGQDRPQRVLIASRIFRPEPAAASFRLAAVEAALLDRGADVTVLTTVPAPGGERGRQSVALEPAHKDGRSRAASVVSRWPALRDKTGYVRGYLPYMSFDIPLFFRLLTAKRPGVILVEPPPTTGAVTRVAAALRRVPYVWYAADVWSDATEVTGAPALIVNTLRAVERFAIRGAAGVIAVSGGVASRVEALGGTNVAVVPNGIDTGVYSPDVPTLTEGELEDLGVTGPYFVYAGTASEWQGAKIFAEAIGKLAAKDDRIQVVFVGQGTEWEKIGAIGGELRSKYGREVVLQVPSQSQTFVARLLAGSEGALVSIVPGLGYDFAYPTKVLAALAAGKPVVYAGAGPVTADVKDHHLGIAVDFEVEAVAVGIQEAMQGAFSAEHLRGWVVENRSMKAMGNKVADFVLGVATKRRDRVEGVRDDAEKRGKS